MENYLTVLLRHQRISYLPNVTVQRFEGDSELTKIVFNKEEDCGEGKIADTDFFLEPDMVIVENGVSRPKKELLAMVGYQDEGSEKKVSMTAD